MLKQITFFIKASVLVLSVCSNSFAHVQDSDSISRLPDDTTIRLNFSPENFVRIAPNTRASLYRCAKSAQEKWPFRIGFEHDSSGNDRHLNTNLIIEVKSFRSILNALPRKPLQTQHPCLENSICYLESFNGEEQLIFRAGFEAGNVRANKVSIENISFAPSWDGQGDNEYAKRRINTIADLKKLLAACGGTLEYQTTSTPIPYTR